MTTVVRDFQYGSKEEKGHFQAPMLQLSLYWHIIWKSYDRGICSTQHVNFDEKNVCKKFTANILLKFIYRTFSIVWINDEFLKPVLQFSRKLDSSNQLYAEFFRTDLTFNQPNFLNEQYTSHSFIIYLYKLIILTKLDFCAWAFLISNHTWMSEER